MSIVSDNYSRIQNALQSYFECPITLEAPNEPVVDLHGHTFERQAILNMQKNINGQHYFESPHTRELIPVDQLYPNQVIEQVAKEVEKFTKELKKVNQLDFQNLTLQEGICWYEGKIVELTAIHALDLQRLGELRLETQQKMLEFKPLRKPFKREM